MDQPRQPYTVRVEHAAPRGIAAVRARLAVGTVPARFREFLDQVYAASRAGAVRVDGQNVFVYRGGYGPGAEVDAEFGVGTDAPFEAVGAVQFRALPLGDVAATTHWGDYARLGDAHRAIWAWCDANGRAVTDTRWEVYGHWSDDPAQLRTDVYYLLGAR